MSLSAHDNPPVDVTPPQSTFPLGPSKPEPSPSAPSPPPADASPSQLDEVLERFDQAWHEGQSPAIDDYLPPAGHSRRLHVLEELVRMDLECRIKAGQSVRIEEYLSHHPELGQDDELLLGLLVQECELRRRQAPELPAEEYVRRFPRLEAELRQRLEKPAAPPAPPPSLSSSAIAGYELLEELGRGGMGVVYKARQVHLNRIVALKMILAGSRAGPDERLRFLVEAEAIASIQHPGIVAVHEFGTHDGSPWFALEYCAGGSLAAKLNGTPLEAAEAAAVVEQIARAVQAAHERGVIHRDLKPANVLLGQDDRPRVTDFGLARRVEGGSGLTQTGAIMGTPSYMPPEQARGQKDVGPAADVYSLGAILYECLTGRPPFKAATAYDTIVQVISQEPVSVRQLNAKTPRDLETICLKCLEKDKHKRYASAEALADDLRRFLNHDPIRARPASVWERLWKWGRRQPVAAALIGVTFLATFALVAAVALYGVSQSQKLKKALEQEAVRERSSRTLFLAQQHEAAERWTEAHTELAKAQEALDAQPELHADDLRAEVRQRLSFVRLRLHEQEQRRQAQERGRVCLSSYDDALFYLTLFTGLQVAESQAKTSAAARVALAVYGLDKDADAGGGPGAVLERDRPHLPAGEHARLAGACYELLLIWADTEGAPPPGAIETKEQTRQRSENARALLERTKRLGQVYGLETRTYHVCKARWEARRMGVAFDPAKLVGIGPPRPTGPLDWFLEAVDHYRAGRYEQARQACGEVLRQQTKHFWARYVLALCDLRRSLDRRPGGADGLRGPAAGGCLAEAAARVRCQRTGLHPHQAGPGGCGVPRAQEDFDFALNQDPGALVQYVGLANRGVLNMRRKDWPEAVKDLQDAVKANPAGFQGYVNLATALQEVGKWDEATAALDRAIKLAPALALGYQSRAELHVRRKQWAAAKADFEQAVALDSVGGRARTWRCRAGPASQSAWRKTWWNLGDCWTGRRSTKKPWPSSTAHSGSIPHSFWRSASGPSHCWRWTRRSRPVKRWTATWRRPGTRRRRRTRRAA